MPDDTVETLQKRILARSTRSIPRRSNLLPREGYGGREEGRRCEGEGDRGVRLHNPPSRFFDDIPCERVSGGHQLPLGRGNAFSEWLPDFLWIRNLFRPAPSSSQAWVPRRPCRFQEGTGRRWSRQFRVVDDADTT